MNGGKAQPFQRGPVCLCAVAFMFSEPVAGILQIEFVHQGIPCGLRQYRGGRDAQASGIPFDQRGLGDIQFGKFEAKVGQKVGGG